jgi:hypothetical protein
VIFLLSHQEDQYNRHVLIECLQPNESIAQCFLQKSIHIKIYVSFTCSKRNKICFKREKTNNLLN